MITYELCFLYILGHNENVTARQAGNIYLIKQKKKTLVSACDLQLELVIYFLNA